MSRSLPRSADFVWLVCLACLAAASVSACSSELENEANQLTRRRAAGNADAGAVSPATPVEVAADPASPVSSAAPVATPTGSPTFETVRIAVGSTVDYADHDGHVWGADKGFSGGTTATVTNEVKNTPDPKLYDNERYGAFSYTFTVPNGSYVVVLGFAETFAEWQSAGKRVFDVSVNGEVVLPDFDIFAAGGADTAVTKQMRVEVSAGAVRIDLAPGLAGNPKLDSISVATP